MKALIGVSTALAAGLSFAGHASPREHSGDPRQHPPPGVQLAQTDGAALPATRMSGVSGGAVMLNLTAPVDGVRFAKFPDFPPGLKLSHGFRLRGYWIVSIGDLPQLQLLAPPGLIGTVTLDVQYFRDNETAFVAQGPVIVELKAPEVTAKAEPQGKVTPFASRLDLAPEPPPALPMRIEPAPASAPTPQMRIEPAPAPQMLIAAAQETEELERGIKLMRSGDIAAARLIFEDLAISGSPKGARALAETYDPAYLKGLFIAGLQPNPETAKKWYRRAVELGDTESAKRLAVLD